MRQDEIWDYTLPVYQSERTTLKQELEDLLLSDKVIIFPKNK